MACRPPIATRTSWPGRAGSRRALFLDRDGVVNVDRAHVGRVEDFEFVPEVFALCREAAARGYLPIIVTNQSGIGRGLYTEDDFGALTRWMLAELGARGVEIAGVYYCPHHPTEGVGAYRAACESRKPGPGMLLAARDAFGLDLAESLLVGDQPTDVEAAARAGVGRAALLAPPGRAVVLPPGARRVARLAELHALLAPGTSWNAPST